MEFALTRKQLNKKKAEQQMAATFVAAQPPPSGLGMPPPPPPSGLGMPPPPPPEAFAQAPPLLPEGFGIPPPQSEYGRAGPVASPAPPSAPAWPATPAASPPEPPSPAWPGGHGPPPPAATSRPNERSLASAVRRYAGIVLLIAAGVLLIMFLPSLRHTKASSSGALGGSVWGTTSFVAVPRSPSAALGAVPITVRTGAIVAGAGVTSLSSSVS